MKKLLIFVLSICMFFALAACGGKSGTNSTNNIPNNNETTGQNKTDTIARTADVINTAGAMTDSSHSKTLVVYFSNTGNTKNIAEYIAAGLKADIFEILPSDPYTSEDLDYNNDKSRSAQEMNDSSSRPAISRSPANLNGMTPSI